MNAQDNVTDRFYRALYAKLLAPEFSDASRPGSFVNLLYKALKCDRNPERVCSFVKRILQSCMSHRAGLVVGLLLVLSELIRHKPYLYRFVEREYLSMCDSCGVCARLFGFFFFFYDFV
jgi:ribosome biogenesis protein MAK21